MSRGCFWCGKHRRCCLSPAGPHLGPVPPTPGVLAGPAGPGERAGGCGRSCPRPPGRWPSCMLLSGGLCAPCSLARELAAHLHAGWLHAFPACDAGDAGDTDPPAMDPGSGVKQGAGPARLPACPLEAAVPRKPARRPERQDARSTYSRQAWALLLGRREPSVPWTPGLCAAAIGARLHTDTALGREVSH